VSGGALKIYVYFRTKTVFEVADGIGVGTAVAVGVTKGVAVGVGVGVGSVISREMLMVTGFPPEGVITT